MSIDTNHYVTSRATVHSHIEVLMCLYLLYVLLNTAHQQAVPYFPDNTNCIVYYKRNKSVLNWLLKETNIISVIHHTAEPVTCYLTKKWYCSLSTFCLLILSLGQLITSCMLDCVIQHAACVQAVHIYSRQVLWLIISHFNDLQ